MVPGARSWTSDQLGAFCGHAMAHGAAPLHTALSSRLPSPRLRRRAWSWSWERAPSLPRHGKRAPGPGRTNERQRTYAKCLRGRLHTEKGLWQMPSRSGGAESRGHCHGGNPRRAGGRLGTFFFGFCANQHRGAIWASGPPSWKKSNPFHLRPVVASRSSSHPDAKPHSRGHTSP